MNMKKLIYAAIALSAFAFSSCGDDDKLPDIKPADRGTVTDNLGNVYGWVRIGDQMWTTSNAKNGAPLSDAKYYNNFRWTYVLDDSQVDEYENEYMPVYGNLMTYDDAMASAPEGWRLPSDEDWKKLERTLGMSDADRKGFRGEGVGYAMQATDSGCELGLNLGGSVVPVKTYGWIAMDWKWVKEYGYYWTSTIEPSYEAEQTFVYYRRLTANIGTVSRECMRSDCYLSVRWVKDVE